MTEQKQLPIGVYQDPEDSTAVSHIKVTNHNTFDLEDRFDGRLYSFRPNEAVTVPIGVAQHIFGFGLEEAAQQAYCMRRFGWNTIEHAADRKNIMYYKNLDIRPVRFRMVEVIHDEPEETAPRPKREIVKRPIGRPRKHPDMIVDEGENQAEDKAAS